MEEVKKYDEIIKGGKIQTPGVPEVGCGPLGAGAGAGGHLGRGPLIRSSSGGHDEAIDTPNTLLPSLQVQIPQDTTAM